jgi:hypothetical protein
MANGFGGAMAASGTASLMSSFGAGASIGGAAGGAAMLATNPIGWAMLGVGAAASMMGTGAERKAGERKETYIGEQQSLLAGAGQQVTELAGMKTELSEDIYGTGLDRSMFQTGQDLSGLRRQGESAAARTGFAHSGQVQGQIQRGMEAGATSFGFQRQGLQDVLGQKLMDISEWEGGEQGRLASEQSRLKYEMAEAKAQSKKKFLGIF